MSMPDVHQSYHREVLVLVIGHACHKIVALLGKALSGTNDPLGPTKETEAIDL